MQNLNINLYRLNDSQLTDYRNLLAKEILTLELTESLDKALFSLLTVKLETVNTMLTLRKKVSTLNRKRSIDRSKRVKYFRDLKEAVKALKKEPALNYVIVFNPYINDFRRIERYLTYRGKDLKPVLKIGFSYLIGSNEKKAIAYK